MQLVGRQILNAPSVVAGRNFPPALRAAALALDETPKDHRLADPDARGGSDVSGHAPAVGRLLGTPYDEPAASLLAKFGADGCAPAQL